MLLFAVVLIRTAWVAEDAYITFRTVDNFINGYGLTWNAAERVQAFTHPLWMFLMSFFTLLTGDVYFTSIFLCIFVSLTAVFVYAFRTAATENAALLGILILIFSKAFTDFSTSGLENPLTHLLLVLFLAAYLHPKTGRKTLFLLSIIAATAALCRPDTILLYLPALMVFFFRNFSRKDVGVVIAGFLPLMLWEGFSILYYGFPFPNPAYAKLNTGIPTMDLVTQGCYYLKNSLASDPITLTAIAVGMVFPFIKKKYLLAPPAAGILLYLSYIVSIGGDFMSGRFLTAPLLCAVVLMSREHFASFKTLLPALCAVLLLGLASPHPPVFSGADYRVDPQNYLDERYITDERGYYFQSTGLLRSDGKMGLGDHPQAVRGRQAREMGPHFTSGGNVGFFGYFAGPDVHILDGFALADPLLARLPVRSVHWRIGHFIRRVPDGYHETLSSGRNAIRHPGIASYYGRLYLITRGDLFSKERLSAIWRMNSGQYQELLEPLFLSRRYMDDGVRSFRKNDVDGAIFDLQQSVRYDSTRSASWAYLARAYMRIENIDEAQNAVLRAVELDPSRYARELMRVALQCDRRGNTEEAIVLYRKYLTIHPDSFDAHVNLASAFERTGKIEQAVREYQRGLQLKPDNLKLKNHLQDLQSR